MSEETIAQGQVVTFHYTLRDDAGEVLDTSSDRDPLEYLHGGGNIVPGLERQLEGQAVGFEAKLTVAPEEGYGERSDEAVHEVPRSQFPEEVELEEGMMFGVQGPDGQVTPAWVAAVADENVTLDFNHPLAGQTLHFDVKVEAMRDATDEEKSHGHPHQEGCNSCGGH